MPEGPEVWALSYALQKLGLSCQSYGKHLLCNNVDYSFGLTGAVHIDTNLTLQKIKKGFVYGSEQEYDTFSKFAQCDWMSATKEEIEEIVNKWKQKKPKHKIISLLKDQSEMCGLGVAWISEIMNNCELQITTVMENANEKLVESICSIRDRIKLLYQNEIDKLTSDINRPTQQSLIEFVNKWCYHNLYKIREMQVYKHPSAKQIKCCGRIFYQLL
jgi:formamidopyrimidine-DNA glycosylase